MYYAATRHKPKMCEDEMRDSPVITRQPDPNPESGSLRRLDWQGFKKPSRRGYVTPHSRKEILRELRRFPEFSREYHEHIIENPDDAITIKDLAERYGGYPRFKRRFYGYQHTASIGWFELGWVARAWISPGKWGAVLPRPYEEVEAQVMNLPYHYIQPLTRRGAIEKYIKEYLRINRQGIARDIYTWILDCEHGLPKNICKVSVEKISMILRNDPDVETIGKVNKRGGEVNLYALKEGVEVTL